MTVQFLKNQLNAASTTLQTLPDYFSSRLLKTNHHKSPVDAAFKLLNDIQTLDKSQSDPIDKWVYKILGISTGFPEAKKDEFSKTLNHQTLKEQVGFANAYALLTCGCACSNLLAKNNEQAKRAVGLFRSQHQALIESNPLEYDRLTKPFLSHKPIFNKSDVNPDFSRQLKVADDRTSLLKKVGYIALGVLTASSRIFCLESLDDGHANNSAYK